MENFEFQPKPDLSSTFRNSIGGFSNIPRFEVFNFNSMQAREIVNESLCKAENEQSLQNSMYGRMDNAQSLMIQQSRLKQKELSLQVKEIELNKREQILIERERQLIKKQMEFQNTQHKIISNKFLSDTSKSSSNIQPKSIPVIEDMVIESNEKDIPTVKILKQNKIRNKKKKSILSLLGFKFKKFSKVRNADDNEEKHIEISPEAQQVAMELLNILNAKRSRFNSSKSATVSSKNSFRR